MCEIIFRGKRVDNGEWVYGDLIHYESGEVAILQKKFSKFGYEAIEISLRIKVIPETVGQYTGLVDKNGTRIFEGDIVLSQEYGTHDYSKKKKVKRFEGVVYYYVGSGTGFCNKETGEWNERRDYSAEWRVRIDDKERHSKYRHGVWGDFYDCEVIGNIHEQGVQ